MQRCEGQRYVGVRCGRPTDAATGCCDDHEDQAGQPIERHVLIARRRDRDSLAEAFIRPCHEPCVETELVREMGDQLRAAHRATAERHRTTAERSSDGAFWLDLAATFEKAADGAHESVRVHLRYRRHYWDEYKPAQDRHRHEYRQRYGHDPLPVGAAPTYPDDEYAGRFSGLIDAVMVLREVEREIRLGRRPLPCVEAGVEVAS